VSSIIGLGKKGCLLARQFQEYPQYRVFLVDTGLTGVANLAIPAQDGMDAYEKAFPVPEASIYFRSLHPGDEVTLIVEGGDPLSGCSLSLMNIIKECNLRIIYLVPDRQTNSAIQKRDDKIAFNILQEYARSGLIQEFCIIDLSVVDELIGDVPVGSYQNSLFYFMSYVLATLDFFVHHEPVLTTQTRVPLGARITTIGVASLEEDQIKRVRWLYPLKDILNSHFIYGIPQQLLNEDATLMNKIKDHVKLEISTLSTSGGYSVFESNQAETMIFSLASSATIQEF
jgi:hypothetical protein